jgi:type VI secretion system secreted protein VgrG
MNYQAITFEMQDGPALDVRDFDVRESLNQPFEVTFDAIHTGQPFDPELHIGSAGVFQLGTSRRWRGIIRLVELVHSEPTGATTYRIELASHVWLLALRRNYRIFSCANEIDIATLLLSEVGVGVELRLDPRTFPRRECRVQYAESDLQFLTRVLEQAGVVWWMNQTREEPMVVLCQHAEAGEPDYRLPNVSELSTSANNDAIAKLRHARRLYSGRHTVADIDLHRSLDLKLLSTSATSGSAIERRLESFHYVPGVMQFESSMRDDSVAERRFAARVDLNHAASLVSNRLAAKHSDADTLAFETNCLALEPGQRLLVDSGGTDARLASALLLVSERIVGHATRPWKIEFSARYGDVPFCPPVTTPRAEATGVELATVVGPDGEEIHTDEFGRVRVRFHWDRSASSSEDASCWVPVSQSWAGVGHGGVSLPRVGHEVLIAFLGSDPDRPVVIGRTFTASHGLPLKLPEQKTQTGIRTQSTSRTGGFNELLFEDRAGAEFVRVRAERDLHSLVQHDKDSRVGNDRTTDVVRDDGLHIGRNRLTIVDMSDRLQVGQSQSVNVGVNRTQDVGAIDDLQVGEEFLLRVAGVGTQAATSIRVRQGSIVLDTGGGASITMIGDKIRLDAETIEIVGRDKVDIQGLKKGVALGAPKGANRFTGPSFSVETTSVSIAGTEVTVAATAALELKGSPVNINGPGAPAARIGDIVSGIAIAQGSPSVFIGGGSSAIGPLDNIKEAERIAKELARRAGVSDPEDFDFQYRVPIWSMPNGDVYVGPPERFDVHEDRAPHQLNVPDEATYEGQAWYKDHADKGAHPDPYHGSQLDSGLRDSEGKELPPRYDSDGYRIKPDLRKAQ